MAFKERGRPYIEVTRKAENSVKSGHPWIYHTELQKTAGEPVDGELVDVITERGKYLGTGFYNSHSKIRIRIISTNANDAFDPTFFRRRLRHAWEYRKTVMGKDVDACRLIFGESDCFPGLTVDRFGDILVAQTLSLGIEKRKGLLFSQLCELLKEDGENIRGVYERNDVAIRRLEGMEEGKGFFPLGGISEPETTSTEITENGIRYLVDFENGQKTGFFLDQKYNRRAAAKLAPGRRVLDCFTHTGSFALNCAKGGAQHVHAVDISNDAVALAERTPRETACGIICPLRPPTCLICCRSFQGRGPALITSFSTRRRLPSRTRRWSTPCGAIRKSTCAP